VQPRNVRAALSLLDAPIPTDPPLSLAWLTYADYLNRLLVAAPALSDVRATASLVRSPRHSVVRRQRR
jgi:hypothetical protein